MPDDQTTISPAEERAERENLPVVIAIAHELLIAASGRPIITGTVDGKEVLLRLPSVDEFLVANAAGREYVEGLTGREAPAPPSRQRVAELVAPLDLPW